MFFRTCTLALAAMLALTTACTNKRVSNPLAKVDSKQPDKVLFDRGMDAMKHNRFDVARLELQTLINTYPESEFIARAKLAMADSWYAEGGSTALSQAEQEYRDFITFFPNMPEAAEAQVKIANIHFQQMEKPDRDFTHAVRAEQEYRQVILQYPDNPKMVEEARVRLLKVQEVIAEREYRIGRFYYLRGSFPASIARLQSLTERYPLYSKADEVLFLTGQAYEGEIAMIRHMNDVDRRSHEQGKITEAQLKNNELARERMIEGFVKSAAEAYSKILTRYPVMTRSDEAKARLIALHQEVPRPTKAMLAQNKAEEDARKQQTMWGATVGAFGRHPDTSSAASVGQPTLQDPEPVSAHTLVQDASRVAAGPKSGSESVTVGTVGKGTPGENQPAPRSDAPAETANTNGNAQAAGADGNPQAPAPDPNDLKPNPPAQAAADAPPDPNELKPNVPDQPAAAPPRVNELENGDKAQPAANGATAASGQELADDQMIASSKHKKKKGLRKIVPIGK